ncbi:MAG: hypothetical protein ABIQ15_03890 [Nocardioides sp.]
MSTLSRAHSARVNRRTIIRSAAWSVPVVSIVGVAAPAFACSPASNIAYSADLAIDSTVGTKDANGHTKGTFTLTICNNGSTTIPAGASYSVKLDALKAPGSPKGDQNILVAVGRHAGLSVSPETAVSLNPDGPTKAQTYVVTVATPLSSGACTAIVFAIDTATGVGATTLEMTAQLRDFGSNPCNVPAPGNQSMLTGRWGQGPTT